MHTVKYQLTGICQFVHRPHHLVYLFLVVPYPFVKQRGTRLIADKSGLVGSSMTGDYYPFVSGRMVQELYH